MSCYHPLYAYKCGKTEAGKDKLVFCPVRTVDRDKHIKELKAKYGDDLVPIPCGHCLGCAMDHAKEWSVRCVLESLDHEANSFITLTYDDQHCPSHVSKREFQLFMKRLRRAHPDVEIRFFGCGEYGSLNGRPHYHLIIFGYDFPDKEYFCHDGVSHIFRSKELESLWTFGLSSIGEVNLESCAYVARYSNKKLSNAHGDEFLLMSRRPGLGANWYQNNKDLIYVADKIYGAFGTSHRSSVPRYFDKLAEAEGIDLTSIKQKRILLSQYRTDTKLALHGYEHDEYLNKLAEEILASRLAGLMRYI